MAGLGLTILVEVEHLKVRDDSQLVVNQVSGQFQAKGENMHAYVNRATDVMKSFKKVAVTQVLRSKNIKIDALAKLASTLQGRLPTTIHVEVLN